LAASPEETQLFPQLAKLIKEGTSPEVRLLALQVLTNPVFNQEQDTSGLPSIAVQVKADGGKAVIDVAGRKLTAADQLAKAVAAATPKEPPVPAFSLERLLKDAANDSDQNLVFQAVQALPLAEQESSRPFCKILRGTAVATTEDNRAVRAAGVEPTALHAPHTASSRCRWGCRELRSPRATRNGWLAKLRSGAMPILAAALEERAGSPSVTSRERHPAMRSNSTRRRCRRICQPAIELSGPLANRRHRWPTGKLRVSHG
jgi:hypothetical protein